MGSISCQAEVKKQYYDVRCKVDWSPRTVSYKDIVAATKLEAQY